MYTWYQCRTGIYIYYKLDLIWRKFFDWPKCQNYKRDLTNGRKKRPNGFIFFIVFIVWRHITCTYCYCHLNFQNTIQSQNFHRCNEHNYVEMQKCFDWVQFRKCFAINQSINQSVNQSINPSTHPSIHQFIHQSINSYCCFTDFRTQSRIYSNEIGRIR